MSNLTEIAELSALLSRHEAKPEDLKPGKLYLEMAHGRDDPDQQLEDWGFNGPTLGPLDWFHSTYNSTLNIKFEGTEATGPIGFTGHPIQFKEDMLFYKGKYYGDWSLGVHQETT